MRVTHDTYGAGRVTGRVDKNRVIVQFDNHDGFHGRRPLIVQEYQLDAVSMDDATTGLISNMESVYKTGVVGLATLWMTVEHVADTYSTKSVSLVKRTATVYIARVQWVCASGVVPFGLLWERDTRTDAFGIVSKMAIKEDALGRPYHTWLEKLDRFEDGTEKSTVVVEYNR